MIRAPKGDQRYWDKWIAFELNSIQETKDSLKYPLGDPTYRPQYVFDLAKDYLHLMLRKYSRGDSVHELCEYFPPLLDAWEEAEKLGKHIWTDEQQFTRHAWSVNYDHYICCFWLIGLAILLDIPDEQWQRLEKLVANNGQDTLLDTIIASRSPSREIGNELCFEKPYGRLSRILTQQDDENADYLKDFVEHWYSDLARVGSHGRKKQVSSYQEPYWHGLGDTNIEGGAYVGRWCIEAAVVAKVFNVDDSACVGHEHYPSDFLRPDGPSTHSTKQSRSNLLMSISAWANKYWKRDNS